MNLRAWTMAHAQFQEAEVDQLLARLRKLKKPNPDLETINSATIACNALAHMQAEDRVAPVHTRLLNQFRTRLAEIAGPAQNQQASIPEEAITAVARAINAVTYPLDHIARWRTSAALRTARRNEAAAAILEYLAWRTSTDDGPPI